jgi:hypothetical protein
MTIENKSLLGFVSQELSFPPQVDIERRGHSFASAQPLQSLKLIHGAIQLTVQMSLVKYSFVRDICRRQTEASGFGICFEFVALFGLCPEAFDAFQTIIDKKFNDVTQTVLSFNVFAAERLTLHFRFCRASVEASMREHVIGKVEGQKQLAPKG